MTAKGKVIIFSAPSGAGKSTITKHLLGTYPSLEFSISATSRTPRGTERDGVEYYFVTPERFRELVEAGEMVEWEEVYKDTFYGTLRSELERIHSCGHTAVFDIDVKGGLNLKRLFGEQALALFVMPPSVEELRRRLEARGTDAPEVIERRVAKAETEMADAPLFDAAILNGDLHCALAETERVVGEFLAWRQ
jgi:guanylate kinase